MSRRHRLEDLDPDARAALCREIMERFSDLVEGTAPEEFCARVAELMADCQPFVAYRNTLVSTIDLAREVGASEGSPEMLDEDALRRCVDRVRERLRAQ